MSAVALPCPFCGEWRGLCATTFGDGDTGTYQCPRCDATGPTVNTDWRPAPRVDTGGRMDAAENWEARALTLWNDRPLSVLIPLGEAEREAANLESFLDDAEAAMATRATDRKTIINKRVQARYDELMREGKHGHYETLFRLVHEERAELETGLTALLGWFETDPTGIGALAAANHARNLLHADKMPSE